MTTLREKVNLFRDLYIGYQARGSNLSTFFLRRVKFIPHHCLSMEDCGMVRRVTSWNAYAPRVKKSIELDMQPETEALAVDCAAWAYLYSPRESKRFKKYLADEAIKSLLDIKSLHCEIVFDVYSENLLKGEERDRRGQQFRHYLVRNVALTSLKFHGNIMRCNQNKAQLT